MAIFCTKCGTSNEDGAGFCDNCGAKLRVPASSSEHLDLTTESPTYTLHAHAQVEAGFIDSKKIIYAGAALAAVLVLGGGAMYFVLQPPSATASTLLAAAKAGYDKNTINQLKSELCISNIDYSKNIFNAGEYDQTTQTWLNAMVAAGLYSPPVMVNSGNFFSRNLLQYVAKPELAKYREGTKLCAAKGVEITDVINIEKPIEESLGQDGGKPKVLTVKTNLVLKSVNTAAWMEAPEVRDAVMSNIRGWEYKDKFFQKKIDESFGLKDNKWTTGDAYKIELRKLYQEAQRGKKNSDQTYANNAAKSSVGSFGSKLSNLFMFGNPLKGTWRTAATNGGFGGKIPAGMGPSLTFTSDSMETSGQSTQVDFVIDGKRVKVIPKGQSQSLIFVMDGPDTMVAQALGDMRYERLK